MSEQVGSWEIQAAAHLEEIDRLRKENERLDFELGDKIGELGELGLEAEALREDAERWRKARILPFDDFRRLAALSDVSRDEAIDAAMSNKNADRN